MWNKIANIAFALIFTASLAGCGGSDTPSGVSAGAQSEDGSIVLTGAEMDRASDIFFNTCAGCHGTLRKGATGPSLLPEARTSLLGTAGLSAFITNGTPGGMPDWGRQGVLSEEEIDLVARFLQVPPPEIPAFTLDDMNASWKLHVPVAERPTEPQHDRNWQNYFGVVLRDMGQVAIIDGDTKEKLTIIETGFAVHILRTSASGRYFYSIGRDGKITMIDLWMETPTMVAEGKASFDARSVEVSKYNGPEGDFSDKYLIVGGYTPSHFVIFDAQTLEPISVTSTEGYALDGDEYVEEARVASIVASHKDPLWVVNVKESGMVWLVDYTDPVNPEITKIATARFLHDGGWDLTGQYFLVAANAENKVVVVDVENKELEAIVETGETPHPGRGANIDHSTLGNLWLTGHLGENKISAIKTSEGDGRWTVVKEIVLPGDGGGNLFIKTHPNSKHLWADRPLNNNVDLQRSVFVVDTESFEVVKTLTVPDKYAGRAVHLEYNKEGTEVWVAVWGTMEDVTAVLVYDDKTLELIEEITGDWMRTPTGHFNVYNTVHDIY
ncbi:MAG: nitrite reductase [Bacteroidetes Order II. Incertae sedis bacterium]|nr:nitrite reductase [Bacteroidetes Order II. bacterium]MBT4601746.1 nitrite reductase [Bacteroidetes Order II. bacterium]MBT5250060.1 nitrite reductase [Bacteroidetes Order II. bacterium]MBT6199203.1 nitrite reductase [Bacteroidetes Order II. bacterium]MBT6425834.1 nitrite reductase [Bacteroidetes Order II. bacterium]